MDPITNAIVAAISAGAVVGVTKVGEQAIVSAYTKLKDLLKQKFGAKSEMVKSVKALEAKPDSAARIDVVAEEVIAAKADQDPELLQAAQALLEIIRTKPGETQLIQTAIGNQNIQVAGDRNTINTSTMPDRSVKPPKKKR